MKKLKFVIWIILLGLVGCKKENANLAFHLNSFLSDKYYSSEIIPIDYQSIYGKWELFEVSGGFTGAGYEPDFDYIEIKSIGIYGLIRNDSLFEYGRIKIDTFDTSTTEFFQIKLLAEFYYGSNPKFEVTEKYIDIRRTDTLDLISPCCDMYNYHFKKIE